MGITKTFGFAFKINESSTILKAMGNPARLKMIQLLLNSKSCTCGDFLEVLPLAQSTVSKHIGELKSAKLIIGKNKGNNIYYSLNVKTWEKVKDFLMTEISYNQNEE